MNIIRDEVFYDRQLELAKKLADVLGNKIKEIKTTEHLYPYEGPFDKKLSYSEVRQANRKKRINVTIVFDKYISKEAIPKLNKIMKCNFQIYKNELWYSMKPERLDFYMRTEKA